MIITCGQCQAKFKVAPEQIKETGSKVRCSNCQHVFTVYRPQAESRPPAVSAYSPETQSGRPDYSSNFSDVQAGGSYGSGDQGHDSYLDDDGYGGSAEEGLTAKERRELRRQLYSDLAEEEDGSDDFAQDAFYDGLDDDDGGLPPLRRAPRPAQSQSTEDYEDYGQASGQGYDDSDDYEDDEAPQDYAGYDDELDVETDELYEDEEESFEGEAFDDQEAYGQNTEYDEDAVDDEDYTSPRPSSVFPRRDNLGLSANPVGGSPRIDDADYNPRGFVPGFGLNEPATVRSAVESPPKKPLRIIIPLALMVLALGVAIYLFSRPGPTALSGGEDPAAGPEAANGVQSERSQTDPHGTELISFTKRSQNHYYRRNNEGEEILIITGTVKNGYPEARSFIQLRGHLLSADGETLADRYVYAGNVLSEEQLTSMSVRDINSQLNVKGGRDRRNINVPPDGELPFMLVFDKLPDGMASYRIDPLSSVPAAGD